MTRVFGPISLRASSEEPANRMRSRQTATASASGCLLFTVQILPSSSTRSGAGMAPSRSRLRQADMRIPPLIDIPDDDIVRVPGRRLAQVALKDARDEEEFGRLLREF